MSEDTKPLDKMTVKELREVAKEIPEITGASGMKKEELLSAIKEAKGIVEEKPTKKKRVSKAKAVVTVKDIKEKIVALQQEKIATKASGDKNAASILRRRINRLKKRSRTAIKE